MPRRHRHHPHWGIWVFAASVVVLAATLAASPWHAEIMLSRLLWLGILVAAFAVVRLPIVWALRRAIRKEESETHRLDARHRP